jgi:hypothetical protein
VLRSCDIKVHAARSSERRQFTTGLGLLMQHRQGRSVQQRFCCPRRQILDARLQDTSPSHFPGPVTGLHTVQQPSETQNHTGFLCSYLCVLDPPDRHILRWPRYLYTTQISLLQPANPMQLAPGWAIGRRPFPSRRSLHRIATPPLDNHGGQTPSLILAPSRPGRTHETPADIAPPPLSSDSSPSGRG